MAEKVWRKLLEKLLLVVIYPDVLVCINYGGAMRFDPGVLHFARFGGSSA
jgi:hypothetical protein